jgi:hypothetical protein
MQLGVLDCLHVTARDINPASVILRIHYIQLLEIYQRMHACVTE